MTLQAICRSGRTVAVATADRFFLCDDLERRPPADPERTFVIFMCAYAGDIASGLVPGPYSDQNACRYAHACLVPAELLERPRLDVERAARALRLPVAELRAARREACER